MNWKVIKTEAAYQKAVKEQWQFFRLKNEHRKQMN